MSHEPDASRPTDATDHALRWTSPFNDEPAATPPSLRERGAYIYDVTLRDGEQRPGVAFDTDERVRIGTALAEMGVARIETGLPSISASVFEATRRLGEMDLPAQFVPMCRAEPDDVRTTAETGTGAITIVHTINPAHCRHVFGLDRDGLVARLVDAVRFAKDRGIHTTFMASDVTRCERAWIEDVYGTVVADASPDVVVVTDTVGGATPWAAETLVRFVAGVVGDVPIEFHAHDDFGMGTATAVAALRAGAAGVHTSMLGLGERTGNAATEEVVGALEVAMDVRTGVDPRQLRPVAELVADLAGTRVAPHAPIVGGDIFATESHVVGLIQDAMHRALGVQTGMFAFAPEVFGHEPPRYLLGKGSGPTAIAKACERLGLDLDEAQRDRLLRAVKDESRLRKAVVSDATVAYLAGRMTGGRA